MSKVWVVTGAGSGIGTGIARAALKAGDRRATRPGWARPSTDGTF